MPPSERYARQAAGRLRAARGRILSEQGFFGLLLMHMRFALDDQVQTAAISCDRIFIGCDFLDQIDADELVYVLEHEILHVALVHLTRRNGRDLDLWNLACDIVVNSTIMHGNDDREDTITLQGELMPHLAPDGRHGWQLNAEEVYAQLEHLTSRTSPLATSDGSQKGAGTTADAAGTGDRPQGGPSQHGRQISPLPADPVPESQWDEHIEANTDASRMLADAWERRVEDAVESLGACDATRRRGLVPLGVERRLRELREARLSWRELLADFVQRDVFDYTFATPDRRFPDSAFLLPGFTETEEVMQDVLLMVDASGSVGPDQLASSFSEIRGALEQFAGRLDGWVGFFDAICYPPQRFESARDLESIRPRGGGGTRFEAVFECLDIWLPADDVSCIVILTDGYAPFPDARASRGIPVLWLICKEEGWEAPEPPWGAVAYLTTGS